jgi:branched-chain amino acid transport system substrate-binding protein
MRMAVDDLKARGGTSNGYTFELNVRDSRGEPMQSADAAREFADDPNIMAILGDFTSGSCMAIAPIVDEAGLVLLSPTASSPQYAPMSDYTFGIMGLQSAEAPWCAEFIVQRYLGKSNVGVIYVNSDWGISSFSHFERRAKEIGLNILEAVNYVTDEMDFSALITRLRAVNPEVVVILDQGAVPLIINQIRGAGWDVQIAALGPGTSAQLLEQAGANAEGLVLTSPFFFDPENPKLMEWKSRFEERAGFSPTIHPACAYDTVMLIATAVEAIGSGEVTRQAIRDNLANINQEVGMTGLIRFNPTGDINREYLIAGVVDGQWAVLEGFGYSSR